MPVKAAPEVVCANGQDDLENRRRLMKLTREVLGIPKHPHLPEAEHFLPQNAVSAVRVRLADGKNSLGRA